ncbi:MAG TPA: hypothetical protein PLJ62_03175 [Thermoflexales bacterium]|nr:hypothetical protein [Thermoflexales bacterium]HQZ21191.1 hypothetical protein [Thermoflexales bacterium]HQZ99177.1 hypothetical protein [Thermoflexales bacterium]
MTDLVQLIAQLAQLAAGPLLIGLVGTSLVMVLIRNWRITLPALILQYALVGVMLARVTQPAVALITPLAGVLISLSLSIAAQRADNERAARGESIAIERVKHVAWQSVPAQVLLRAVAATLTLTAAFGVAVNFPLPGSARELGLAAYVLLACGALIIAIASEALNGGIGLLMIISGIELGYTPLEPSLSVVILLGLMNLLVGVAIAYLTLADANSPKPA